ncbi:unnamed protein product [Didymodactylos carnosus]|uniref:Fe2OG dioxygenase domain-containing protein n=1 Tax=Didymodactylos carnosus TaxID=1234261 RepID=A0A815W0G1_9BILA|nr:unnamed protein product [Didymodactylos carnosus]CAF4396940.1 unnamed protein product [Didymodactylos carnosus]
MKFIITQLLVLYLTTISYAVDEYADQCSQQTCLSLNIDEIDISKYINGTDEDRNEIALLFDKSFHNYGIVRLINHQVSSTNELFDKAKEFFSLDLKTKMNYFVDEFFGYKPSGSTSVANYNGEKKTTLSDSVECFLSLLDQYDNLPTEFQSIVPKYMNETKSVINSIHQIVDMALELDEDNSITKNYTNHDKPRFTLRIAKYLPNEQKINFGAHKDYLGFSLIENDHVSGLEIEVNNRWYQVIPKPNSLLLIGGEFIERWTNNYWISALHRVSSVTEPRYSAILFTAPDLSKIIDVLPCKKCLENHSSKKYEPVTGYDHLQSRDKAQAFNSNDDE